MVGLLWHFQGFWSNSWQCAFFDSGNFWGLPILNNGLGAFFCYTIVWENRHPHLRLLRNLWMDCNNIFRDALVTDTFVHLFLLKIFYIYMTDHKQYNTMADIRLLHDTSTINWKSYGNTVFCLFNSLKYN
jgi:hypothetical protein